MNFNILKQGKYISGIFAVGILLITSIITFGQTEAKTNEPEVIKTVRENEPKKNPAVPYFTNYKEVKIGMTADEVKEKLGKPKVADKDGFFYIISQEEQVQIGLDENKQVRVIVVMYDNKNGEAPSYEEIFGVKAEVAKQSNESIYSLVRYPLEGFWVAYHSIKGDAPTVTVTIQKMHTAN